MTTATGSRSRAGFLHRLQCARGGHSWERQLSGSGEDARWVCVRCGKRGNVAPLGDADDAVGAEPAILESDGRVVDEDTAVIPVVEVDAPDARGPAATQADDESERHAPQPAVSPQVLPDLRPVIAVAATIVVIAGAYLALRRRRSRR